MSCTRSLEAIKSVSTASSSIVFRTFQRSCSASTRAKPTKSPSIYASSADRALIASRELAGGIPRAGDIPAGGPIILPNVETIDVTAMGEDVLGLDRRCDAQGHPSRTFALAGRFNKLLRSSSVANVSRELFTTRHANLVNCYFITYQISRLLSEHISSFEYPPADRVQVGFE